MKPFRRVLHASDFSPASQSAFRQAVDVARANRAELVLVHVLAPIIPADGYIAPSTWDEIERGARAAAETALRALAARARKTGVRVRTLVAEGVAATEIVRAARATRADVIVMGTHGRGGLARLFLGSVAARVVATALCPVLTVRGATRVRRAGAR